MRQSKTKAIRYGGGDKDFFHVRAQGVKVRMQDMDTAELYLIDPPHARKLAAALNYAAKHAERPLIPFGSLPQELQELLNGPVPDSNGEG